MITEEASTHRRALEDQVVVRDLAARDAGRTGPLEPKRVEATSTSVRATVEALHTVFGGSGWAAGPDDDSHVFRYLTIGDDRVMVGRSRMRGSFRGSVAPVSDHVVATVVSGTVTADRGRGPVPLQHGVPKLWAPGQSVRLTGRDHDMHLVRVDAGFLADTVDGTATDVLHMTEADGSPSTSAMRRWSAAVRLASGALARHGIETREWRAAVEEIARTLPGLFSATPGPLASVLAPLRSDALRAAVTHLHANVDRPVSLTELIQVSGISARTVQEGFHRAFGISPTTYHRRLRLEAVRRDLLDSDGTATKVADVARRWGFSHLGRFAGAYADEYGEYPKTTLRS